MLFDDRRDAGRRLGERLRALNVERPCVVGLPRGGIVVGDEVAGALDAPLDVVLVRKIGAPGQSELAVGAIAVGDRPRMVVIDEIKLSLGITGRYLEDAESGLIGEIERRRELYGLKPGPLEVHGMSVIVVDDGIATGATIRAAVQALRGSEPARLIVAVPVAPPAAVTWLREEADELVCLDVDSDLDAVSMSYRSFPQVGDDEVVGILERRRRRGSGGA